MQNAPAQAGAFCIDFAAHTLLLILELFCIGKFFFFVDFYPRRVPIGYDIRACSGSNFSAPGSYVFISQIIPLVVWCVFLISFRDVGLLLRSGEGKCRR
jgi:hypothetical protein